MMDEEHEIRVRKWMLDSVIWWLDDAIKLLFGFDPHEDTDQLVLEGNDIVVRAGLSARQDIARGKLIVVGEKPKADGTKNYRLSRDEFVKWAKENFSADGDEFYAVWSDYKKSRPKIGKVSKQERNRAEWQAALDELYIKRYEELGGKKTSQKILCDELANFYSGSKGTILRYTKARNREWIIGKIESRTNLKKS